MPTEKRPPEGTATGRARRKMDPILREWYGESGAESELMKYLPSSQPVGDVIRRVMQKKLPHGIADFRTISDHWDQIAGEVAARHTTPLSLSNKTLFIEVEHPAYLASVRTKAVQSAILTRIAELIGADKCTVLTFTPAGRRRSV
jgi:predicted nucleic acid-binding Zn ribbon protein